MVLREKDIRSVQEYLKDHKVLGHRQVRLLDEEVLVRICWKNATLVRRATVSQIVLDAFNELKDGLSHDYREASAVIDLPHE